MGGRLVATAACAAVAVAATAAGEVSGNHADAGIRRPLHLPSLESGEACPRSVGGRPAPKVGIALGGGPAYPVMGMEAAPPGRKGVVNLEEDERRGNWYLRKTLWAVAPHEGGPILIRGARIDRPGILRFEAGHPGSLLRQLSFPRATTREWRYGVSSTAIRGPGCYAFQIDGETFSRVVVFRATR